MSFERVSSIRTLGLGTVTMLLLGLAPAAKAQTQPAPQSDAAAAESVPSGAAPAVTSVPPAPTTDKPGAPPPVKTWKDLLVLEGLVDAYYLYNFTGHNSLTPASSVRQFDVNSNSFTLNYAKLGFGVSAEPVGVRIDIGYGATGQSINAAVPAENVSGGVPTTASPFVVQQAFATVVLPLAVPVTVDFGKFVTSASAEVIEANKNWLYSRSFLFFNTPLLHTGLRLTAKLSDALSVQASVVNGWNGVGYLPDVTRDKTFGLNVAYTAPTKTSIVLNTYFGKNESTSFAGGLSGFRVIGELVVNQEITDKAAAYLDVQYVNDGNSLTTGGVYDNFIGAALAGRYLVAPHLTLAARGEYARNGESTFGEGTVMVGVPMENRFEARLEARADFADTRIFNPDATGAFSDKNQVTGLVAFLGWF